MKIYQFWQIFILGMLLSVFSGNALAVIETYEFSSDDARERYNILVEELRCPKCQNQNLSGSNSPIAQDLRRELYRMIEAGDSDTAVKAFMVKRYGNFVLYRPPLDRNTIILWSMPVILGFIALLIVLMFRSRLAKVAQSESLTAEEKEQLANILETYR